MPTAIDFETYYDKDYSVAGGHPHTYCQDPKFDPYLVSLVNDRGLKWAGHPSEAPWDDTLGDLLVAHNAAFDWEVYDRCVELGIIPAKHARTPLDWICTADMSRYFQGGRSLAGAMYGFFKKKRDKSLRDNDMKGKGWADIVAAGLEGPVLQYAIEDGEDCLQLYNHLIAGWPEQEQRLSALSRWMGRFGARVDMPLLESGRATLQKVTFETVSELPWTHDTDPKTKKNFPPTSPKGLALTCQREGILPPENTRKDSPELDAWMEKYGKTYKWVSDMATYRQANKHLGTLDTLHNRVRDDETIPYGLKYGGADTTMRFSGDSGFNTQNMPRDEKFGVNIRNIFIPRQGCLYVDCDLSQIEPRCLGWGCGDMDSLDKMAQGMSPYEVHARNSMGYTKAVPLKKDDPSLYSLAKARVLSLGYGASWHTFIGQARTYGADHIFEGDIYESDIDRFYAYVTKWCSPERVDEVNRYTAEELQTAVNSWLQVCDYRRGNPLVRDFWNDMGDALKDACSQQSGSQLEIELPSGRVMRYMYLSRDGDNITGFTQLPESPSYNRRRKLYGALLVENFCQGMARDVFCHYLDILGCEFGYDIVFQIHDQVVIEVEKQDADRVRDIVEEIMSTPIPWAPGLPVAAEADVIDRFKKG
jgi:hypothetical protein